MIVIIKFYKCVHLGNPQEVFEQEGLLFYILDGLTLKLSILGMIRIEDKLSFVCPTLSFFGLSFPKVQEKGVAKLKFSILEWLTLILVAVKFSGLIYIPWVVVLMPLWIQPIVVWVIAAGTWLYWLSKGNPKGN